MELLDDAVDPGTLTRRADELLGARSGSARTHTDGGVLQRPAPRTRTKTPRRPRAGKRRR